MSMSLRNIQTRPHSIFKNTCRQKSEEPIDRWHVFVNYKSRVVMLMESVDEFKIDCPKDIFLCVFKSWNPPAPLIHSLHSKAKPTKWEKPEEARDGTLGPMRSLSYLVLRTSAIFWTSSLITSTAMTADLSSPSDTATPLPSLPTVLIQPQLKPSAMLSVQHSLTTTLLLLVFLSLGSKMTPFNFHSSGHFTLLVLEGNKHSEVFN